MSSVAMLECISLKAKNDIQYVCYPCNGLIWCKMTKAFFCFTTLFFERSHIFYGRNETALRFLVKKKLSTRQTQNIAFYGLQHFRCCWDDNLWESATNMFSRVIWLRSSICNFQTPVLNHGRSHLCDWLGAFPRYSRGFYGANMTCSWLPYDSETFL